MDDLPGALTVGLGAASLAFAGPAVLATIGLPSFVSLPGLGVPLVVSAGLGGLGKGISAQRAGGFGPGARVRKSRNRRNQL